MFTAYAFEAKSIQAFVLDGGKLKDMVGASNLLDATCDRPIENGPSDHPQGALLDSVLAVVPGLQDGDFTRRAGGAFIIVHADSTLIERFRMLWQIAFQQHLPRMDFTDALGQGTDAMAAISAATEAALPTRNVVSLALPAAHPLMQIAPRSGAPAAGRSRRERELVDEPTERKRLPRLAGSAQADFIADKFESAALRKLGRFRWPVNMDASEAEHDEQTFPLHAENAYVGVVHADGNGMGQTLVKLRGAVRNHRDAPRILRAFSTAVVQAMQQAAQDATVEVLVPGAAKRGDVSVLPARPLVLAGDDVTAIVRGDLAVAFAASLVRGFRKATRMRFEALWRQLKLRELPPELTAGAGIAFVKASQPFGLAYGLAAQLTKLAKQRAKEEARAVGLAMPEGTIAFHRITTTFIDDYDEIVDNELKVSLGGVPHLLSCNPYSVEPKSSMPRLDDLEALRLLIANDALSRGPLRHLADLFQHDQAGANATFERWLTVINDSEQGQQAWQALAAVLARLGANSGASGTVAALFTAAKSTPLVDAMQWHMAKRVGV